MVISKGFIGGRMEIFSVSVTGTCNGLIVRSFRY